MFICIIILPFIISTILCNPFSTMVGKLLFIAEVICFIYNFKRASGMKSYDNIIDEIYVKNDQIHYQVMGRRRGVTWPYKEYVAKDITKVIVTEERIIIYGNILLFTYDGNKKTTFYRKKLKLPREITYGEKLIEFAKSMASNQTQSLQINNNDKKFSRRILWKCISAAVKRFVMAGLYYELIIFNSCILIFCFLFYFEILGIWIIYAFGIWGFLGLHIEIKLLDLFINYLSDVMFKKVNRYEGFFHSIKQVSNQTRRINTGFKNYADYFQVTFYDTLTSKVDDFSVTNEPIDGMNFMLKDKVMINNINRNNKAEIMYLKHSKVIVSIKVIGEEGSKVII